MKSRDKLSSRLGFILISAGCAIGIGNVYKFPIMTGYYGGGFFVLFYLLFLVILGFPVMTMELAVGRGSKGSAMISFNTLEKPGQKWHLWRYACLIGNYALMACYIIIVSWIAIYFVKFLDGNIMQYQTVDELGQQFGGIVTDNGIQIIAAFIITAVGFGICALGLNKGVENVTKVLMVVLFIILIGMVIYSFTLSGAGEGIAFYLIPSVERLSECGVLSCMGGALSQAFFTLSLGIGSIAIFGSYIDKDRTLGGEAIIIIALDTFVALMCGFIIFPACYTYAGGVEVTGSVSASFVFQTFSSVFTNLGVAGRVLGSLFFALLLFAAFSTVIAVFENIMSFWLDTTKLSRPVVALINFGIVLLLLIPGILGNNVLSGVSLFGMGIMDLEDNLVSKILLPVGCLIYCMFCSSSFGWGFDNYLNEANTGKGVKIWKGFKFYFRYVLPVIILAVLIFMFV